MASLLDIILQDREERIKNNPYLGAAANMSRPIEVGYGGASKGDIIGASLAQALARGLASGYGASQIKRDDAGAQDLLLGSMSGQQTPETLQQSDNPLAKKLAVALMVNQLERRQALDAQRQEKELALMYDKGIAPDPENKGEFILTGLAKRLAEGEAAKTGAVEGAKYGAELRYAPQIEGAKEKAKIAAQGDPTKNPKEIKEVENQVWNNISKSDPLKELNKIEFHANRIAPYKQIADKGKNLNPAEEYDLINAVVKSGDPTSVVSINEGRAVAQLAPGDQWLNRYIQQWNKGTSMDPKQVKELVAVVENRKRVASDIYENMAKAEVTRAKEYGATNLKKLLPREVGQDRLGLRGQ